VTKVLIFDMDETLIHCVDDIEKEDPDVVLEIDFPDEETVYVLILYLNIIGWNKYKTIYNGVFIGSKSALLGYLFYCKSLDICRCYT
jgi:FMN phosphatase YigB (HAD superfamily)